MTFESILPYLIPALIGIAGFFGKLQMNRIQLLEKKVEKNLTEQQTRQILADKLEPVKETLDDVKVKIDKLYDLLLK